MLATLVVAFMPACGSGETSHNPDAQTEAGISVDSRVDVSLAPDADPDSIVDLATSPLFTVTPTSIDLGRVAPGVASPKQRLKVTALAPLLDLNVSPVGPDVTLDASGTCGLTLAAGTSCTVVVDFLAATIGGKSDSIAVSAGGQTVLVSITAQVGVGGELTVVPSAPQTFVASAGMSSSPITFAIANSGTAAAGPMAITIIGPNADHFAASATGCDLVAPGNGCTIAVVFSPTILGSAPETATLMVTDTGPGGASATIPLNGVILSEGHCCFLVPATSDLGSVSVGSTGAPVVFTLRNVADEAVSGIVVSVSSTDFVITSDTCTGASLPPGGGTCTLAVALRPATSGAKTAVLVIDALLESPMMRLLTGVGVPVDIDASIAEPPDGGDATDQSLDRQSETGEGIDGVIGTGVDGGLDL